MSKDQQERRPEETSPEGKAGEGIPGGFSRHARASLRVALDHVWGPTGSVLLHLLALVVLIRFVTFESRTPPPTVEVVVMEPEGIDLEDLVRELDVLPEFDVEVPLPDMDITMEVPDDAPPPEAPAPQEDLAPVEIRAEMQSPLVLRGLFMGRTERGRQELLRRYGGRHGARTGPAAERSLEWLRDRQLPDGSWQGEGSARAKTAMTGMALLCFLAYGQTPQSERFGSTVERGLRFLVEQDQRADGTFRHTEGGFRGGVYSHGIAAYALSEAFALTRIPSVGEAAARAVSHIVRGQRPDGGFDYEFERDGGARDRCTSVAAWMAQAMKAAFIAGVDVPDLEEAMVRAAEGFKLNADESTGMFIYASGGRWGRVSEGQTAPGVLSLQLLGQSGSREAQRGVRAMSSWRPNWQSPPSWTETLYLWYYATQVFFHAGGRVWTQWNDRFSAMLLEEQNEDGSWTWPHGRSAAYGPVYATTFSALSLMVYYRYLPTYQPIAVEPDPTHTSPDDVVVEIL